MNVSFNWLSDYVETDLPVEEVADRLTMAGLEVEEIRRVGPHVDGVVVGKVLGVREHPNADRLVLCDVDLGGAASVQIVCGAPNVAEGQKVAVAPIGTVLMIPDGRSGKRAPVTIKKTTLRGEISEGMICSELELGLGVDHEGILVLDTEAEPGASLGSVLEAAGRRGDVVLDIELTPNRPDAACHIGVARDLAAITDKTLRLPEVESVPKGDEISVRIEAPEACHRYVGLVVRGVKVGKSPSWLRARLEAVGLRSVNNVVDVASYVMFEMGQPLHAFDLTKIAGPEIVVRESAAGESITTLDDQERELPEGALLICDAEKPVAIAGVMGGANSEVSADTSDVLIESAYFDPSGIRKTAKALGLTTDASYRFERGVDPTAQARAAARCARLMVEAAGGAVSGVLADEHPTPYENRLVALSPERVTRLLGVDIPTDEIRSLLESIGFSCERPDSQAGLKVTVPPFRPDVEREVDVIEEVARIYGYERVPTPDHTSIRLSSSRSTAPGDLLSDRIRDGLSALGFREVYTNSLLRSELAEAFADPTWSGMTGTVIETLNPVSREMAVLRPSLLPGVLGAVAYNQARGVDAVRVFEIGHVFSTSDSSGGPISGYKERDSLLIVLSGIAVRKGWDADPRRVDYYDLKGVVEWLFDDLQIHDVEFVPQSTFDAVLSYGLELMVGGERLAILGQVRDEVSAGNDVNGPVFAAELDLEALQRHSSRTEIPRYQPVDRYPRVERDLALAVDAKMNVGPLLEAILEAGQPLLQDVRLFDLFEGRGIEEGKKSVAFALRFGADRTLKDAEVDEQVQCIVRALEKNHGAVLRS